MSCSECSARDSSLITKWLNSIRGEVTEKDNDSVKRLVDECECYLCILSTIRKHVKTIFGNRDYECEELIFVDPSNISSLKELGVLLLDVKRVDRILLLRNKKTGEQLLVGIECKKLRAPRSHIVEKLFNERDGLPHKFSDFLSSKLLNKLNNVFKIILGRNYCDLRKVGIAYIRIEISEGQELSTGKLDEIISKCQKGYNNSLPRDDSILSIVYDDSLLYIIHGEHQYKSSLKDICNDKMIE